MTSNTQNLTDLRHAILADRLGQIKAQKADISKEEKEITDQLKAEGVEHISGNLFQVDITFGIITNRSDWKAIAAKAGASRQLITANTKAVKSDRVSVKARKEVK